MTARITTQQLREELTAHLESATPPPADLDAVLRRSRRSRVRRTVGPALLAVAAVGIGALVLTQTVGPSDPDGSADDAVVAGGPVDVSDGLRAYASPGENLYMGGGELPYDIEGLDTDATTTPYGIVFYDQGGSPWLLRPTGERVQLDDSPSNPDKGFSPTAKADALQPHVAFAVMDSGTVTLTVYDLDERSVVATTDITCPDGGCADLVIDGIDSGAVFVRMPSGTSIWDYERRESYRFAGPDTRVADVRNGVVLYDGPAPTENADGWRLVPGAIDAQLTFDGRHVLYWSDTLEPTTPGGQPVTLDLPVPATFFSFDTDGSVMAATVNDPVKVFDCEIPSGPCTRIGQMTADHGDPLFVGSDM